nr:Gag-Pol polyprotein [Tanacetum cinerariifolium]
MHQFYQRHPSGYHLTKDHPLEEIEPKNIKEAMANHAWIEARHEELHQFDRLDVWKLVDKPFGKTVIGLAPQHLTMTSKQNGLSPVHECQDNLPSANNKSNPSMSELELLFSLTFYEYFTEENEVVSKPFIVLDKNNITQSTTTPVVANRPPLIVHDIPNPKTLTTQVNTKDDNNIQAEDVVFDAYEFINPFATL